MNRTVLTHEGCDGTVFMENMIRQERSMVSKTGFETLQLDLIDILRK